MVNIVEQIGIFHFSFPFVVITIGCSWSIRLVSRFFISISTFLFITRGLSTLNRIDPAETLGVEGVDGAVWVCLAGFIIDGDWIEPTILSTGTSTSGLVGSVLERGD